MVARLLLLLRSQWMPEPSVNAKVLGIPEAQKAFRKFGREIQRQSGVVATEAAETMLPDVRAGSRRDTGTMIAGFGVDTQDEVAVFVNTEFYWTFQEFGTHEIEPTNAIMQSWEKNEKDILKEYDKHYKEIAEDNGFEQSR